jgi:hypothetical protein
MIGAETQMFYWSWRTALQRLPRCPASILMRCWFCDLDHLKGRMPVLELSDTDVRVSSIASSKPSVRLGLVSASARTGTRVSLECAFEGTPNPQVCLLWRCTVLWDTHYWRMFIYDCVSIRFRFPLSMYTSVHLAMIYARVVSMYSSISHPARWSLYIWDSRIYW